MPTSAAVHKSYVKRIHGIKLQLDDSLAKHAKSLLENPSHTMEWADSVFSLAARHAIIGQLINMLDDAEHSVTMQTALEVLEENHHNATRYINNYSTSPSKNLMTQHRVAELTEEIDYLRRILKTIKTEE